MGWWLWSSADVVWYGRVLNCASPGFRGFRISVPKTSEYFTIEPIGSIVKYSNVLGTYGVRRQATVISPECPSGSLLCISASHFQ